MSHVLLDSNDDESIFITQEPYQQKMNQNENVEYLDLEPFLQTTTDSGNDSDT